jgi:glycosyltransferase involved in cell wall biosynthesis
MKVALIHTRLLRRGGLESRLFNYMEWFVRNGHEVHVFVFKLGDEKPPTGVQVHVLPIRWIPKPLRPYFFDRALRRHLPKSQFDLTLTMGRNSHVDAALVPATHLGYLARKGRGPRSLSDRLQILLDRKTYATCKVLLPSSELMLEELSQFYGVPASRCEMLYPPLNTEVFHAGVRKMRQAERERLGWKDDRKYFLLLSNNHVLKGLPLLLEAFSQLRLENVELVVSGPSPVEGSHPNVTYLGHVTSPAQLYAAADFTLVPSQYESFGQVVSESIACGTPVLVSSQVGAKTVVTPQTGWVIDRLEPKLWAAQIVEASKARFEMDDGFASRFALDLDSHMRRLLDAVAKHKGK